MGVAATFGASVYRRFRAHGGRATERFCVAYGLTLVGLRLEGGLVLAGRGGRDPGVRHPCQGKLTTELDPAPRRAWCRGQEYGADGRRWAPRGVAEGR